jgi:D-alanine-D-alanine ligase-like ATP-grasp enzyme
MEENYIAPSVNQQLVLEHLHEWPTDSNTACMEYAAQSLGIKTRRRLRYIAKGKNPQELLEFTIRGRSYTYRKGVLSVQKRKWIRPWCQHINTLWFPVTSDKEAVKQHLIAKGYSVPEGRIFLATQSEAALVFYKKLGRPACIKPNNASGGKGVFAPIKSEQVFRSAFELTAAKYSQIIVEEYVEGSVIRLLYAKPYIIGARSDKPAYVVGDGHHTIAELIEIKNKERIKRKTYLPIVITDELLQYILNVGISLAQIPEVGRHIRLVSNSQAFSGGESWTCGDTIHPSYLKLFGEICATMPDLKLAGIDVIIRDYRAPARSEDYRILEINSSPGVAAFYFPWEGQTQDVASVIIERLVTGQW